MKKKSCSCIRTQSTWYDITRTEKEAVKKTAKVIGDLIEKGYQVAVTHSNAPQVGMIHTAMNEFAKSMKITRQPQCRYVLL